jgi:hypothetical protein
MQTLSWWSNVSSSLVERRLGPCPFLSEAFNYLLDGSDVKLSLLEFVPRHRAEFGAVAAESVLLDLVRERVRRERRVEHGRVGILQDLRPAFHMQLVCILGGSRTVE